MVHAIGEADLHQQLPRTRRRLTAAGELDRELDVLSRGQEGDQVPALEDDADATGPKSRPGGVVEARDFVAIE